ncbi:MAG: antibiotic biosynthesis monooxygenase [Emcibacter sp.]|nr:antibiotic biosynthesis monooxygenase [Emcibacter sp.]MBL4894948.1 antibiotic biosynthesis monooxygenase [Emcibacter sp.]
MSDKPAPPYYAVIFSSVRTDNDDGYAQTIDHMLDLGLKHPGCLGFDNVSEGDTSISVSYWKDLESIKSWKQVADHITAQKLGREKWYKSYTTRIALVEREYSYEKSEN